MPTVPSLRGSLTACLVLLGLSAPLTPAAAQGRPEVDSQERTIRASGTGEVQVAPDAAWIHFAVESFAGAAREAGQQNARVMQRVIAALGAAGVPRDSVETSGYSIQPEYVREERETPRIRGYRASNRVVVRTGRLDQVGALIDVALGAGANRFEGVTFLARDTEAAQAEALRRATQRARASAEAIAGALGVALGPVLDASTSSTPVRPLQMRARAGMEAADFAGASAAPTPIQPGEQTVRAFVSVVFSIAGRP